MNLDRLRNCFQGHVPASIATVSAQGKTNVTYISKVHLVDAERVALSNQFMSKTARNIMENPRASVLLTDPISYEQYRLQLGFERSETKGPIFDRLSDEIEVIAAIEGVPARFKLQSADIFRVREIQQVPTRGQFLPRRILKDATEPGWADALKVAHAISRSTPELAFEIVKPRLEHLLHDAAVSLHLATEQGSLQNVETFDTIAIGQGLVGTAALRAETLVLENTLIASRYAKRVANSPVTEAAPAQSAIAVPLIARSEIVGVLEVKLNRAHTFTPSHTMAVQTVANALAPVIGAPMKPSTDQPVRNPSRSLVVRFYASDSSVFIGDDYLIRGLAGDVFAYLISQFTSTGATSFSSRELKMAPDLQIPGLRDNLEARIHTLIQRLSERKGQISLSRESRGRYKLGVTGAVSIETIRVG